MNSLRYTTAVTAMVLSLTTPLAAQTEVPVNLPTYEEGKYVHQAPTVEDLMADESLHPELREVILKGRDMFLNTQQFRGEYVFNDMTCKSCHMGEGRMNWSGPVWPAVTTLPDFRGKNRHVNSVEERIAGCFAYSMNGQPPAYGSDDMLAMVAYHQWLARSAPVYERNIAGRGFSHLGRERPELDYGRGREVYEQQCAVCHGDDGQGQHKDGQVVFPPLWGDDSYNWGAGMTRIFTAASFIKNNMPLGKPGSLSDDDAWQVANYINSQERPQDPRYTGDVRETREQFYNFHQHTNYGTEVNGQLLGDHDNTGHKPFLKPDNLRPRTFE
ncbi:MAG: c-type cytochrome [Pseudomonadales bacterium]|uniref:c-type cytochrome n=1 Tax=Marinobacter xestospongiae TaxID=994319 RepID=UPI0020034A08|nr:c-type cytochrome [Marinobacter xestospongiae]MCG8518048.1 c-type cytochrome [Pseudomonadales bacterium]MCK7566450.1 c-type cytochrome [Marinobacter xestospongiae]